MRHVGKTTQNKTKADYIAVREEAFLYRSGEAWCQRLAKDGVVEQEAGAASHGH